MDRSLLFPTRDEAEKNPAADIYLERAAAKVSVTALDALLTDGGTKGHVKGNEHIDFEASDFSFALDNFNTSFYLLRRFNTSWQSYRHAADAPLRFIDTRPITATPAPYPYDENLRYRTYFAEDVNFSGQPGLTATTSPTLPKSPTTPDADPAEANWLALDESACCAENTFDVAHMTDENTTSVLIRLQLNGGHVFYNTSVAGSDVIFQAPASTLTEEGTAAQESFARRKSTQPDTGAPNYQTIDSYLRQWLMQFTDVRQWVDTYAAGNADHIKLARSSRNDATGVATFTATQTATKGEAGSEAWADLEIDTKLLQGITVWEYPEGYCYYRVLIRHFEDGLSAAWQSATSMNKQQPATVYTDDGDYTAEQRYLGRWGVVRNNWYTIGIRSVTHVGTPVIPALTTYADDVVEQLINAQVVVSKWAVHSGQEIDITE